MEKVKSKSKVDNRFKIPEFLRMFMSVEIELNILHLKFCSVLPILAKYALPTSVVAILVERQILFVNAGIQE